MRQLNFIYARLANNMILPEHYYTLQYLPYTLEELEALYIYLPSCAAWVFFFAPVKISSNPFQASGGPTM